MNNLIKILFKILLLITMFNLIMILIFYIMILKPIIFMTKNNKNI